MNSSVLAARRAAAAVCAIAALVTAAGAASAQSTDRMRPTPLTSGEVTGRGGKEPIDYWYSFAGGPGDVNVSVDVQAGSSSGSVEVAVKDALFNDLATINAIVCCSESTQKGERVDVRKSQALLLKIHVKPPIERFSVAIGGAVAFIGPVAAAPAPAATRMLPPVASDRLPCIPKAGILRIEMEDGSAQEVNLARARRVFVK